MTSTFTQVDDATETITRSSMMVDPGTLEEFGARVEIAYLDPLGDGKGTLLRALRVLTRLCIEVVVEARKRQGVHEPKAEGSDFRSELWERLYG